jgi:hypothetical protein
MEEYFKAQGLKGVPLANALDALSQTPSAQPGLFAEHAARSTEYAADLAWHVRAWGLWVLREARRELAPYYPTYTDFQPATKGARPLEGYASRPAPLREDGTPNVDTLNAEFIKEYLADPRNARWVAKPAVAYLWARTVTCKSCRATVPLLKTRWLCKKNHKRIVLTMTPNTDKTGVTSGIHTDVPMPEGNMAQRREHDKQLGGGTMSRSGVTCPCCGTIMTMEDLRLEGQAGRLGTTMTAVVVDGPDGKDYRLPTDAEIQTAAAAHGAVKAVFADIPFGLPNEPLASKEALGFRVPLYGFDRWHKLFTARQLLALGTFVKCTHGARAAIRADDYVQDWNEAIVAYLACIFSRTADYMANLCVWEHGAEEVKHVFMRWALPITWDFGEANPLSPVERFYLGGLNSAFQVLSVLHQTPWRGTPSPDVLNRSAIAGVRDQVDILFTDPPYYDAIPYSDLMDYFYVWLRRTLFELTPEISQAFQQTLSPKWDGEKHDGELIDDASRHGGNPALSKQVYEDGMYRSFLMGYHKLASDGRLVVVFANKKPLAWETLVAAIIRAGFCVTGSWPIVTEMSGGLGNLNRASLASSIWLVCKKRPETARAGWDKSVLTEMQANITTRLRDFWDAGIRGPDFVWAATGPALEAYSKYPVVKKADEPGQLLTVTEFLGHVRRMVVEFVVGRVLSGGAEAAAGLDDATTYYLLHRNDFGMEDASIGACILYAISCGLSDQELADRFDLLIRTGSAGGEAEDSDEEADESEGDEEESTGGKGNKARLKPWSARHGKNLGHEGPGGRPAPLIDQVHRLLHLWRAGDVAAVDDYLEARGLRRNALFGQLLQALIELAPTGSEERALLESISNHVAARGASTARLPGIES